MYIKDKRIRLYTENGILFDFMRLNARILYSSLWRLRRAMKEDYTSLLAE